MDKKLIYRELSRLALSVAAVITSSFLLVGCSQAFYQPTTFATDDIYATHNRDEIIKEKQAEAEARQRVEQQRKEYWANELGLNNDRVMSSLQSDEAYNSPYGAKLAALSATTEYQRPSSYYELQYDETLDELAKYDPAKYDAYINSDGEVIVEPKYVSSMYGTWGDPYYTPYAWTYGYPRWGYYSAWGYPRYSWWDYNYNFGWGYGWGWGYSPYYYGSWWGGYPYYGYNWYRPIAPRPPYGGGGGGGGYRPSQSIVKRPNITNSPSSSIGQRRVDGSTVGRSSSSSYNRGGTTRSTQSYSTPTRTPSMSSPSMSRPSMPSRSTNSIGR